MKNTMILIGRFIIVDGKTKFKMDDTLIDMNIDMEYQLNRLVMLHGVLSNDNKYTIEKVQYL